MADLAFAPQHNMTAYLEKTENNAEFHQIVDFLTSSSIHHSLTVSPTIYASNIEQFWNSATSQTINDEKQIYAIVDGKTVSIDPPLPTGYTVGSREDMMEHNIELTDPVPKTPHNSPLSGGHTPGSDEGSMILKELIDLYTTLLQKVLDLENVKIAQAKEIGCLKKRVTKLEQRQSLRISGFHPLRAGTYKRRSLGRRKVSKHGRKNLNTIKTISTARPDISAARPEVSTAKPKTPPTAATLFDDEDVTIADTLVKIKNQKATEKGIAFKDVDDSTRPIRSITTLQPLPTIDPKDKGKGLLQEPEHVKKTKKKDQDQIKRDAKVSLKIEAHLDEEARTERERQEKASKATLAEMYDEVQAHIDAGHELVVRLTHEEQKKYTVEERSKLLAEFFKRRKKQLAKERAKSMSFEEIQKLYIKEQKCVDAFVPIGSEEDEKRIGNRKKRATCLSSKHKSPKKQKVNDQESEDNDKEHKKCLKVVLDDDKAIDYETLDLKSLIVDYESQVLGTNEAGDLHVYKLTRLDGSYRHFSTFSRMLEYLDRQDVLGLHKIIMERFLTNDPESYDLILWGDLNTLVESRKQTSFSGPKLYSATPFPKSKGISKIDESHALSKPVTSNSIPTPQESKVMKNDKVIAPGKFRINPFKTSREEKHNANTEVVCAMCKQCLITSNHDACMLKYVNDMNSGGKKQNPEVKKPKKVGSKERLASPTPSEPSITRRWSPTGRMFDCYLNLFMSALEMIMLKIKMSVCKVTSMQKELQKKDPQVKEYQVKYQDPRSQTCKRNFKRIPKNTRLQDSRRHKKDPQLNDHPLEGDY
uniref:Uncharacterized protein n=1 Tax=Tanacetum cinerariifolium TaxID=118510 RepID=A0A6L2NP38_TANCI|nr:hypothetical protein [Tanacetum cinerariifolium]